MEAASSELDTTAILTFFQGAAETAAGAVGSAVAEGSVEGGIGLAPGFYFWDGSGPLERIDAGGTL